MKVIKDTDFLISSLLGNQEYNPEIQYKTSLFNIYPNYNEETGEYPLFNTLTRQLISLSPAEYGIISYINVYSRRFNAETTGKNSDVPYGKPILRAKDIINELKCDIPYEMTEKFIKELAERRFLTPVDTDEYKLASQLKTAAIPFGKKDYIKSFTIMTTTACNARCWYCYELGRSHIHMTAETAEKAAQFILKSSGGHKVRLSWFGGEPLFNSKVIDIICRRLRENGKEYTSSMVSNGYLFDENVILRAQNDWNLKTVQITLDGTEKIYNDTKGYIYKEGSAFKKVLDNIETLLKSNIRVQIRLNIDEKNCSDLSELCDYLISRFSEYDNITVYTAVIMHYEKEKCIPHQPSSEFKDRYIEINEKLYAAGINNTRSLDTRLNSFRCMADNEGSAMLTPDGGIGKCEHFSESDYWRTLDNPEVNHKILDSWRERDEFEECKSCPHFPMCIKLKKCPDTANACTDFEREILDYHLEKRIKLAAKL